MLISLSRTLTDTATKHRKMTMTKDFMFQDWNICLSVRWMGLYSPLSDVVSKHTIIKSLARCFYCSCCTLTVEFVSSIFFLEVMSAVTQLFREMHLMRVGTSFWRTLKHKKALNNLDSVRVHLWNLHYMRLSN